MLKPGLYVVATPIGNLQDVSLRARNVLSEVELIAAEDTRHSIVLLNHCGIKTKMRSLHEHNEENRIPGLLEIIHAGGAVALISDAGTPLISDPGFKLVRAVVEDGLDVFTVPGPCALTAALSVSGLPTDRFQFQGFLPARASNRIAGLKKLAANEETLVFYESGHRVLDCLADIQTVMGGERRIAVCRELTKQYETVLRGPVADVLSNMQADSDQRRGEFVLVLEGSQEPEPQLDGVVLARELLNYLPASQASRVAAKMTGGKRRDIYAALES